MDISIIIVNYNVKHFLELCLLSVRNASGQLAVETIVVDNNSSDDSLTYLQPRFPEVQFIANKGNKGFGKACNQGLDIATGRYILFLNPDTILSADSLQKSCSFFAAHEDAGAIGVRMIDGSGQFLKESKRAFPSPITSLYKLSGLSALFPKSRIFSRYHLGHLSEWENHEVDVLSGAFMMIRKDILDRIGGFDEAFFMYGEDIDLSYRVQQSGYKNYYVADISIIHFKGESTSKGSLNYVKMFYQAMSLFVNKHYAGKRKRTFNFFIHVAIWLRATITLFGNFIKKIGLPLVDFLIAFGSLWLVKWGWNYFVKSTTNYDETLLVTAFSLISLWYIGVAWFAGYYDKVGYRPAHVRKHFAAAIIMVLAVYSLLPETLRFSRSIILLGSLAGFMFIKIVKTILQEKGITKQKTISLQTSSVALTGDAGSFDQLAGIITQSKQDIADTIPLQTVADTPSIISSYQKLPFDALVLACNKAVFEGINSIIQSLPNRVQYKFHAPGADAVVGSADSNDSGAVENVYQQYQLNDPSMLRSKRLTDITAALVFLFVFPLHFIFNKRPVQLLKNAFNVLLGKKTWVGYRQPLPLLPPIAPGIVDMQGRPIPLGASKNEAEKIDLWYAKHFTPQKDWRIILKNYPSISAI